MRPTLALISGFAALSLSLPAQSQTSWNPNNSGRNDNSSRYDDSGRYGRDDNRGWVRYDTGAGCFGEGKSCSRNGRSLRIRLENRPIESIRIYAHDHVDKKAEAFLHVRLDNDWLQRGVKVERDGREHRFNLNGRYGNDLVLEFTKDDAVVESVEVLYEGGAYNQNSGPAPYVGTRQGGTDYWNPEPGGEWAPLGPSSGRPGYDNSQQSGYSGRDWVSYPRYQGCYGFGSACRRNGSELRIPLENRPVVAIRFRAHDDLRGGGGASIQVRIDNRNIVRNDDVLKRGKIHEYSVRGIRGRYLILEVLKDEVEFQDIEIRYDY